MAIVKEFQFHPKYGRSTLGMRRPKRALKSLKIAQNRLKSSEIAQKLLEIAENREKKSISSILCGRPAPRFIG